MSRPFEDAAALARFAAETRAGADFACEPVRLSAMREWGLSDGVLTHRSGGFFQLCGMRPADGGRPVLAIYQPQSALCGLLIRRDADGASVLVHARVEPGNPGVVQYAPTVQSTAANYMGLHGGGKTPMIEVFQRRLPGATPLGNLMQADLGASYLQKTKTLSYVACGPDVPAAPPFAWARLEALAELAHHDFLLNTDLRSMLAVFDWDAFLHGAAPAGKAPLPDPDLGVMEMRHAAALTGLDALMDWRLGEDGIHPLGGAGHGCGFWRIRTATRERTEWDQPLIEARHQGLIRLYLRQGRDGVEFLLALGTQPGLTTRRTAFPSTLRLPSAQPDASDAMPAGARVLADILVSDEGGRFRHQVSRCQLVEDQPGRPAGPGQAWVGLATVKRLVALPLATSIELRTALVLALPLLNPRSLGHAVRHG